MSLLTLHMTKGFSTPLLSLSLYPHPHFFHGNFLHLNLSLSLSLRIPHSPNTTPGKFPTLFSQLALGNGVVLKNRCIMGSMHTGLEESYGGRLTEMAAFYAARAKGGAGLIVTGGIAPSREGWLAPFAAKMTTSQEAKRHQEVTESVHQFHGAKIAMQILHSGRYGYHPFSVR